jgi:hypothetical protein
MGVKRIVETVFALQDKMTGPLGAMQGKIGDFAGTAQSMLSSITPKGGIFGSLAGQVAIGTLAAKGIEKAFGAVRNTIASIPEYAGRAGEIADTAGKIGIATDALQKYRYAASLGGISNEKLNTAFLTLNKNLGTGSLVTSMGKVNAALADQVKKAPTNEAAFRIIARAASSEGDAAKRAAILNSAFGKSGAELIPMLGDLAVSLEEAGKYGNIISARDVAIADTFGDTVDRVKAMAQSLGDTVRSGILRYITPLVTDLQEWIAANRELVQTKIQGFIEGAVKVINSMHRGMKLLSPVISAVWDGVKRIAGSISPLIDRVKDWVSANGDLIRTGVREFAEKLSGAIERLVPWISRALELVVKIAPAALAFVAALWSLKTVVGAVSTAMGILHVIMSASPITLIVLAVAALIIGFILLASKVGGVGNAFKVIGKTMLKLALTPFNLVITAADTLITVFNEVPTLEGKLDIFGNMLMKYVLTPLNGAVSLVGALLGAIGHIPGANWAKGAAEAIKSYQDKANVFFTGSESTIWNSGGKAIFDPAREVIEASSPSALKLWQNEANRVTTGSESTFWDSGFEAYADPYTEAKEAEDLRKEAARLAAKSDEKQDETNDLLRELLAEDKKNTAAVEGLNDGSAQGVPGRLSYASMGQEDFFSTARAGL